MEKKIIDDLSHITHIFETMFLHGNQIELSQEIDGQERRSWSYLKNININSYDFAAGPLYADQVFDFNENYPIYGKNVNGSILFIGHIKGRAHKKILFIHFPDNLYIMNERLSNRVSYEKYQLPVTYNNFTIMDYSRKTLSLEANLLDISESGIALKSRDSLIQDFNIKDKIIFTFINGYSLSKKITGRIVYIKEVSSFSEEPYFRVAIHFDRLLPFNEFNRYIENQLVIQNREN